MVVGERQLSRERGLPCRINTRTDPFGHESPATVLSGMLFAEKSYWLFKDPPFSLKRSRATRPADKKDEANSRA